MASVVPDVIGGVAAAPLPVPPAGPGAMAPAAGVGARVHLGCGAAAAAAAAAAVVAVTAAVEGGSVPPGSPTTPTACALLESVAAAEPPASSSASSAGPSLPRSRRSSRGSLGRENRRLGKSSSCGELSHMVRALISPGVLLGGGQPMRWGGLLRPGLAAGVVVSPRKQQQQAAQMDAQPPGPMLRTNTSSTSTSSSSSSTSSRGSVSPPVGGRRAGAKWDQHKASLANELCLAAAQLLLLPEYAASLCALLPSPTPPPDQLTTATTEAVAAHLGKFPPRYCLSVEAADVVAHMALLADARREGRAAVLVTRVEPEEGDGELRRGVRRWAVTVGSRDRPHLLDALTRTLSAHATQIVEADAMTGEDGMALDRFVVESPAPLPLRRASIAVSIEALLQAGGGGGRGGRRREGQSFLGGGEEEEASSSHHRVVEQLPPPSSFAKRSQEEQQMEEGEEEEEEEEEEDDDDISMQQTPPYPPYHEAPRAWSGSSGADGEGQLEGQHVPFEEIELLEVVTRGPAGALWRGQWRGQAVAVKMITATPPHTSSSGGGGGSSPRDDGEEEGAAMAAAARLREDFDRERRIVRGLRHPNLCRLLGTSVYPGSLCLVYEFLEGGSLAALLRDRRRGYDLLQIAVDVAEGMDYLHKRGIMHRDLKPDNLLLHKDGRAVIADFGLVCPTISESDHTGETGTYRYMSSEVIRHEPYSTAADVYSFGVVLNELLTREQPFWGMTPIQAAYGVARQGLRPAIPGGAPPKLAQLIQACWHEDQIRRPTFSQILRALRQIRAELQQQRQQPPPPTAFHQQQWQQQAQPQPFPCPPRSSSTGANDGVCVSTSPRSLSSLSSLSAGTGGQSEGGSGSSRGSA